MTKNTNCAMPWMHAAVDMNGDIMPCCRFKPDGYKMPNIKDGLTSAINGDVFKDIRERLASGERISNCFKCWEAEDNIGKSMRTDYSNKYKDYIGVEKPVLKYLEIGFSTHCNLACRMCSEDYSSTWYKINNPSESIPIGFDLSHESFDADLSNLFEIKVVGGEPMMTREHDDFVDRVVEQHANIGDIRMTYHTNGSILPSKKVVSFWRKLGELRIYFSIDGVGKVNEYQRPGHKWQTIVDNIEWYKKLDDEINLLLGVHTTVTALNVMHLADVYKFYEDTFSEYNYRFTLDTAEGPDHLCIQNMPEDLKHKAIDYIERNIPNESHKTRIIKKLKMPAKTIYSVDDIKYKEIKLDNHFKQSIDDVL